MCTYRMYKMFKFCIDTTKLPAFCVYSLASLILNMSENKKKSINFNINVSHTAIHFNGYTTIDKDHLVMNGSKRFLS